MCSLAKLERAIVSCPAAKARPKGPGGLVPPPPDGIDRVEFELQLLSMLQVLTSAMFGFLRGDDSISDSLNSLLLCI